MSKRLVSFFYEDVRYFTTMDGGYLQNSFPGKNAVSINDIQVNPGYSAAVTQPWGTYRPATCPISEDATVVKVGDNFIAHGTCAGYRFELTEVSYEIEEITEEAEHVTDETLEAAAELSDEEEHVEDEDDEEARVMVETLEAAEEYSEPIEIVSPISGGMRIGRSQSAGIKINASLQDTREKASTLVVDNPARRPDRYRGVRFGVTLDTERESAPSIPLVPTVRGKVVVNPEPRHEEPVHKEPVVEPVIPVPEEPVLSFDNAPKPSMTDFDCMEFLAGLSKEQTSFLSKVPINLIGTIHEFTKEAVSEAQLMSLGSIYCVNNKWKISGDWYAIDEIQTLSRCIYCATTNEYQRISTKTLKGWMKCVEAGVIG